MLTRLICEPASRGQLGTATHTLSHQEWMALIGSVRETITQENMGAQPDSIGRILSWARGYIASAADPCDHVTRGGRATPFQLPRRALRHL